MKRILVILMTIAMSFSFISCKQKNTVSEELPSAIEESSDETSSVDSNPVSPLVSTLENTYKAFIELDNQTLSESIKSVENVDFSVLDRLSDNEKDIIKKFTEKLNYKVLSETMIDSQTATVRLEITNSDYSSFITDLITNVAASSILSETDITKDEIVEIISSLAENEPENTVTQTVDLQFTNESGKWKIDVSPELIRAVSGGMLQNVQNAIQNDALTKILNAASSNK